MHETQEEAVSTSCTQAGLMPLLAESLGLERPPLCPIHLSHSPFAQSRPPLRSFPSPSAPSPPSPFYPHIIITSLSSIISSPRAGTIFILLLCPLERRVQSYAVVGAPKHLLIGSAVTSALYRPVVVSKHLSLTITVQDRKGTIIIPISQERQRRQPEVELLTYSHTVIGADPR